MVLVVLLVGALLGCARRPVAPIAHPMDRGVITAVADGDTVSVRIAGRDITIRLIGVDTPEVGHHGTEVECYGPEASARIKEWLPIGTEIRLTRDQELHDIYDRTLAYVYVDLPNTVAGSSRSGADQTVMINMLLAQHGLAVPLTIAPNLTHADAISAASRNARQAGLGLWGACPVETAR